MRETSVNICRQAYGPKTNVETLLPVLGIANDVPRTNDFEISSERVEQNSEASLQALLSLLLGKRSTASRAQAGASRNHRQRKSYVVRYPKDLSL